MKSHKTLVAGLLAVTAMAMAACVEEVGGAEGDAISIPESAQTLSFSDEGGAQEVAVNATNDHWQAFANAEWLKAVKQDGKLNVVAAANTEAVSRQAQISLLAGGETKTINVEQSGKALTLTANMDAITIEEWGGAFSFYVASNINQWRAEATAPWVKVVPDPAHHQVSVEVAANNDPAPREAVINITDAQGGHAHQVRVSQKEAMSYILPYAVIGASVGDVKTFETQRRSILADIPDGFLNQSDYTFNTKSPIFPTIIYTFGSIGLEAMTVVVNPDAIADEAGEGKLINFLKENGFTEQGTQYYSEKLSLIVGLHKGETPTLAYTILPIQDQDYPTFDKFPPVPFFMDPADKDKIYEAQAAIGGTEWTEKTKANDYWFKNKAPGVWTRYYLPKSSFSRQIIVAFNDIHLALYEFKGKTYPTKEFLNLLSREGYTLNGTTVTDKNGDYEYSIYVAKDLTGQYDRVLRFNIKVPFVW